MCCRVSGASVTGPGGSGLWNIGWRCLSPGVWFVSTAPVGVWKVGWVLGVGVVKYVVGF